MKYRIEERVLHFKQPAGTSRGVYTERKVWYVHLSDGEHSGVGECAPLPDLSCDARADYGEILNKVCEDFCEKGTIDYEALRPYPSMLFGLETALLTLRQALRQAQGPYTLRQALRQAQGPYTLRQAQGSQAVGEPVEPRPFGRLRDRGGTVGEPVEPCLFDTAFSRGEVGIPINGLVWMGSYEEMLQRMEQKLEQGFHCVKLKIGAIDFERELDLVKRIRERFSFHEVELRLDANGAFPFEEALYKLELLSQYAIHSIEQPIKARQWAYMAELCRESPLPIALDEELIGVNDPEMKRHMLNVIKPRYIILKPSVHGGMQ